MHNHTKSTVLKTVTGSFWVRRPTSKGPKSSPHLAFTLPVEDTILTLNASILGPHWVWYKERQLQSPKTILPRRSHTAQNMEGEEQLLCLDPKPQVPGLSVSSLPASLHAKPQALGVCHQGRASSHLHGHLGPRRAWGRGRSSIIMLGLVREGPQTEASNRSLTGWRGCPLASGDTSGFLSPEKVTA